MNTLLKNLTLLILTPLCTSTGCTAVTVPEARDVAAGILQVAPETLVDNISPEDPWYGFRTADRDRYVAIRKINGEYCIYRCTSADMDDEAKAEEGTQLPLGSAELAAIALQEITTRRPSFNPADYDMHLKDARFNYVRRLSPTVVHARDFVDIRLNRFDGRVISYQTRTGGNPQISLTPLITDQEAVVAGIQHFFFDSEVQAVWPISDVYLSLSEDDYGVQRLKKSFDVIVSKDAEFWPGKPGYLTSGMYWTGVAVDAHNGELVFGGWYMTGGPGKIIKKRGYKKADISFLPKPANSIKTITSDNPDEDAYYPALVLIPGKLHVPIRTLAGVAGAKIRYDKSVGYTWQKEGKTIRLDKNTPGWKTYMGRLYIPLEVVQPLTGIPAAYDAKEKLLTLN